MLVVDIRYTLVLDDCALSFSSSELVLYQRLQKAEGVISGDHRISISYNGVFPTSPMGMAPYEWRTPEVGATFEIYDSLVLYDRVLFAS